jgi:hypothetical protein
VAPGRRRAIAAPRVAGRRHPGVRSRGIDCFYVPLKEGYRAWGSCIAPMAHLSGLKLDELNVSIVGFFLIEVLALFVITYLPFTTLWVPRLFGLIQ